MRRQRIIPGASKILKKIMGVKPCYVHIAMLFLISINPVFISLIVFKEGLLWNHAAHNYLRAKGYNVSKFPMLEGYNILKFKTIEAQDYDALNIKVIKSKVEESSDYDVSVVKAEAIKDPGIERAILELYRDIPYYTDEEARFISLFWRKWIMWPLRILSIPIGIFLFNYRGFERCTVPPMKENQ